MKKLLFLLVIVGAALFLAGCSTWSNKAAPEIARYVDTACVNLDPVALAALLDSINSHTSLGEIEIICEGDP